MAKITKTLSAKINKETGKAEILLRFVGSQTIILRAKSGIYISPKSWKTKEGVIKTSSLEPELQREKEKLDNLCNKIVSEFTITDKEKTDKQWIETIIDKFHFPEKYEPKASSIGNTLFSYIADFIEKAPLRKDKATGRLLTHNNIQQYQATYKHLQAFAAIKRKKDFQFKDINQQFYNSFVSYLQSEIPEVDKLGKQILDKNDKPKMLKNAFTQNSVGKHIRILKLMLNEAPKGLIEDVEYENFHVFTEEVDTIYLNESELQKIKDYDFSKIPHLDRVRDWFLLLAWTGCRFSDLSKIGKTDIRDGFISFRQQKTNAKVTIPLHPVVMEILEKYEYNLPEPISNQRFNEYIKDAAKQAGIVQTENITSTIGGKLTTAKHPKYELISSHTGRRSFATNMYKQGLPSLMIMSITGHKTEKSFLKYIRVKQEEHATLMAKAWSKLYEKGEQA